MVSQEATSSSSSSADQPPQQQQQQLPSGALAQLCDESITSEHMGTVLDRLRQLHGPTQEVRVGRESWQLLRCVMRYNQWRVPMLKEGVLTFPAPGGFAGRVFPLLTSEDTESYATLTRYNPGLTSRKVSGRSAFSPGMLFKRAKQGDPNDNIVAVTLNPSESEILMYDEGLFPVLQQARIAVHIEDSIRSLTPPPGEDSNPALTEQQQSALQDLGKDEVWFAKPATAQNGQQGLDAFSACFTPDEPGFSKGTLADLLKEAAGRPVHWRYVTNFDDRLPCVWHGDFVTSAAQCV